MTTFIVSWPASKLFPNRKAHWSVKNPLAQEQKREAIAAAKKAGVVRGNYSSVVVAIEFHPPSNHRRDLDNLLAAMKGGLDGLSQVIGVDDSEFQLVICKRGKFEGGKVVFAVEATDAQA